MNDPGVPAGPALSVGEVLGRLDRLRREPAGDRGRRAWELVVRSQALPDFGVVLEFALDYGLVLGCDGRPWVNPLDGSEMIWIPPGPFVVGPHDVPAASGGFSLARFPVTRRQFRSFLGATGYRPPADDPDPDRFAAHWLGRDPDPEWAGLPAVGVSLVDALAYGRWAGLSLPTEWLWEKAARGPDGRPYPWGDAPPLARGRPALTNVDAPGPCPVGQYPRTRTPYGCEDLVGNVSEWCVPAADDDFGRCPEPWPAPPEGDAPVRGSCYLRHVPARMRSYHRRRLSVTRRNAWVGFRPALFLPCRPAPSAPE